MKKQLLRTCFFGLIFVSLTTTLCLGASDELTQAMAMEPRLSPQSLAIKLEKFWHDQIWNKKKIARNVTLSLIALHLIALSRGTSVASKKAYPPTNWLARGADAGAGRLLRAVTNQWAKKKYDAAYKGSGLLFDPKIIARKAADKKARYIPADPFGWNQLRASDSSIPFLRRKEAVDIAHSAQQRAKTCPPRWRRLHTVPETRSLKENMAALLERAHKEVRPAVDFAKTHAPLVANFAKAQVTPSRLRTINTALAVLLLKMVSSQIGLGALV